MLAKGLLKDRLVKAAEGGTEIFEFREQELLVPVGHVVLGLGGLLDVHGLGHGLRKSGHLWENHIKNVLSVFKHREKGKVTQICDVKMQLGFFFF